MQAVISFAHCLRSMELKAYGSWKNAIRFYELSGMYQFISFSFGTVESGTLIHQHIVEDCSVSANDIF